MFAVVVDVDYVGKQQLKNLLSSLGMVCSFVRLILSAPARGYIFTISCRSRFSCIETGKKCLRS